MENSVLSDASGVGKNISQMYQEYASSIGKSSDALTQAEKAQAVYNGFMAEAGDFIGTANEMSKNYQGQQAQLNATNLELSRTIGESMIPTLTQYSSLQLSITKGLTDFIKEHKSATSGVITFTTTLLSMIVALTAAKKAYTAYKTAAEAANMTTKAFTASLLTNPITAIAVAIAAVISSITVLNTKMQETIDKMDEMTETSQQVTELIQNFQENDMTYTESEATQTSEIIEQTKQENIKLQEELEKRQKMVQELKDAISFQEGFDPTNIGQLENLNKQLTEQENIVDDLQTQIQAYNKRIEVLNQTLDINSIKQKYATLINQKAHRETLIDIAQTKADIQGKQTLLNILKKGKTTTDEYTDAKNQLVKVYPELAKVNENTIASTQKAIDAENAAADAEWVLAQTQIQKSMIDVQVMMSNSEQIQKIAAYTKQSVEEVTTSLQNQIDILANLAKLTPDDFKGSVTTTYVPKSYRTSSSSSVYQNKALDNYKALIEYKKSLDQLSLKQEISMYQKALNSYAKTTEEKRELRTKIYELNKELAQKEKELLDQQTEDYEAYIQEQINLRGAAYDVKEQTKDYDAIIKMHKNYLNQIMKDERLSLDERKELYREELQTIRDYEQQKRDLRVESIDNTVSQLTDAITKQLEEMQEKDKEMIDKNLEEVEKWKNARIDAINEEYDARIEAIDKELEALNKAEEQKSRDEEDAEYEKKKKRLEDLIAFEHDATNKANYQKELDKLVADYQKTLEERALQDKKDLLEEEKDKIQEEQDAQIDAIENEAEKRKKAYEQQLDELEKYYDEQIDMAQDTAEKMLLNVEDNQKQILNLLKKYGNAYEITGQSLGEKLAQGINEGVANNIQNVIQKIQDTIDTNIESKIKEWTKGSYSYSAGTNKPQVTSKTINVYQTNNIEQNPELPSETYRKLKNIDEQLAAQLAGI
nr:MAG TPA: ATPase [Caudoviricetes sp.]